MTELDANEMTDAAFPEVLLREDGRSATDSERRVLGLLRQQPGQSRAELGRRMDIAGFSASRIVDGLLRRGLVAEGAPVIKGRGYPSATLSLRPEAVHSIGISLMTDAAELVVVDFVGSILARRTLRLESMAFAGCAERLREAMDDMLAQQGLDRSTLVGAGLGITGYFIGDGERVNPPAQLDDWALVDFKPELGRLLDCGVWLDNDGNVAALGEAAFGVGDRYASFAYLFFGAGFGGGLVVDGALMRGHNGNAGEFGGSIPPGYAIPNLERLRASMERSGGASLGLTEALALASPDAPGVGEWLAEAAASLNIVVSSIAATMDPQAIVFGGRLSAPLAQELIMRLSFHNPERRGHRRPMPTLVCSTVSGDATAMGAATLPLKAAFF